MKKKIVIVTLCWQRYEIFEIFAENLKRFIANNKDFNIEVWCAISEFKYISICQRHGFNFYTCDNTPLGKKLGQILSIIGKLKFDYILLMNSGNVFSDNFLGPYKKAIKDGCDVIAPKDLYFIEKGKFYYRKGYQQGLTCPAYSGGRDDEPAGCGRLLSYDFLKQCNFKPIWEDNEGGVYMDGVLWGFILKFAKKVCIFNLKENDILFCGLKGKENLHSVTSQNCVDADIEYLYKKIPDKIGQMIKNFYK